MPGSERPFRARLGSLRGQTHPGRKAEQKDRKNLGPWWCDRPTPLLLQSPLTLADSRFQSLTLYLGSNTNWIFPILTWIFLHSFWLEVIPQPSVVGKEANCVSLNSSPGEAIRSETLPLPQLSVLPTPCCLSKCGKKVPQTPSVEPRASQDFQRGPTDGYHTFQSNPELVGRDWWISLILFTFVLTTPPPAPMAITNNANSTPALRCLNTPSPSLHTTSLGWVFS